MINIFDEAAKSWDNNPEKLIRAEKFANEIIKGIKGENYKTALEYGCGTGLVSFLLQDNFEKITLADISQGMLKEVKDKINKSSINISPLFYWI